MTTTTTIYYIIGALIVIAILVGLIFAWQRARSVQLQRRFGPEYERALRDHGDNRAEAEGELARREARVKKFHLEELPAGAKQRYVEEWRSIQTRFVDEPRQSLVQADSLVTNVLRDRGYPISNVEQQSIDISPDHPGVVEHYREAHEIAARSDRGEAATEELRRAMIHYRTLFDDLIGTNERKRNG